MKNFLKICVLFAAGLIASCGKDDDTKGEAYFRIDDDALYDISFVQGGGHQDYLMYSNMGAWRLESFYAEDTGWLDIWPDEGEDNGRFTITVSPNAEAVPRYGAVNIIFGNRIFKTIQVSQTGTKPMLEFNLGGGSSINTPAGSTTRMIRLTTNVAWTAECVGDAAGWIKLSGETDNSVNITVMPSPLEDGRSGEVVFRAIGTGFEDVTATLTVKQQGSLNDVSNATTVTIAQLLADMPAGGEITDNLCIWAQVTSDYRTRNVDDRWISYNSAMYPTVNNCQMWVQDDSGRGLLTEFTYAAENVYDLNTRMQIHLVGLTLERDQSGAMRLAGLTSDAIFSAESSAQGVAPIELATVTGLDDYENTLVTLKNVEFAVPVGTYVNIHETGYDKKNDSSLADERQLLGDTYTQYGHLLRDSQGNVVKLLTASTFTEKFTALMPEGSGDVTGIIMKRKTPAGDVENVIRIRRHSDNAVSEDRETRLTGTIARFGPFSQTGTHDPLNADDGEGTLKTSVYATVQGTTTSVPAIYWNWSWARNTTAVIGSDEKATPAFASSTSMQYATLCCYGWWNVTGTSYLDPPGEAWIITTSTRYVTGKLFLSLTTMGSGGGPRDFVVEWAESEDTPKAGWKQVGEYKSVENTGTYHMMQKTVDMGDEMTGKDKVVIRLRASANYANRNTGIAITSTGSSMLGFLEISELK